MTGNFASRNILNHLWKWRPKKKKKTQRPFWLRLTHSLTDLFVHPYCCCLKNDTDSWYSLIFLSRVRSCTILGNKQQKPFVSLFHSLSHRVTALSTVWKPFFLASPFSRQPINPKRTMAVLNILPYRDILLVRLFSIDSKERPNCVHMYKELKQ